MCYYVKVTFLSTLAANLSVNNIYFQIKSTVTVPSTIVNGQGQDVYTKTQFRCQSPMLSDLTLQHNLMKGHFWSYFTYYYIEEHGYFFNHTIFCVSLSKCSVLVRQIYLDEGSKSGIRLRASSPHGI